MKLLKLLSEKQSWKLVRTDFVSSLFAARRAGDVLMGTGSEGVVCGGKRREAEFRI